MLGEDSPETTLGAGALLAGPGGPGLSLTKHQTSPPPNNQVGSLRAPGKRQIQFPDLESKTWGTPGSRSGLCLPSTSYFSTIRRRVRMQGKGPPDCVQVTKVRTRGFLWTERMTLTTSQ